MFNIMGKYAYKSAGDGGGCGSQGYDIERLMREYGNDVLRTAYSYVRDMHIAEDIYQEVFIKVYKNLNSFLGDSSIKTWITRITINTCKDYLKSAYSRRVVPMFEFREDAITSDNDFEEVESRDTNECIKAAVMALPEKYREVVMCVYFQGMGVAEAAGALDLPEGTVKSRLARAKEKLRKTLEGRL